MMKKLIAALIVLALSGCEKETEFEAVEPVKAPEKAAAAKSEPVAKPTSAPAPAVQTEKRVKPQSLKWTAPATWKESTPSSAMRLAEYKIDGEAGAEPSIVSIFFFGGGQGGDVEQNVARWIGQFSTPDGKPVGDTANRGLVKVGALDVHTVDAAGTYNPGMAGGNRPPKEAQRMLGAIVELPEGRYFFKLVGPIASVDKEKANFDAFVQSFTTGK